MRKVILLTWSPFLILATIFIVIKLHSLGIRASDTNIYFYTAKELLAGKILYKDVFFTNFPLIPYMALFYFVISGGNLLFYYFTAVIEVLLTGGLLYYLVYQKFLSRLKGVTTAALYFFSFMILSTSDHQTGVFLAALFVTFSYFWFTKKRFFLVGIFTALALLTKAYTLPLLLSYVIILLLYYRRQLIPFILGGSIAVLVILSPSILFAPQALWHDVFEYSLTRSQGISKAGIFWFVLQHDFLILVLLSVSILLIRKATFLGIFALLSLLFFIFYKDVYYLYLNVTLPLLSLILPSFSQTLEAKFPINRFMLPTIIAFFIGYNFITYFSGFDTLQVLPLKELLSTVKRNNPAVLYGVNGITPALAYLDNKPLLNGIVDTNDNIFRKGYLNATKLTDDAITHHALIVTQGVWYPEAGVVQDVMTEIVDQKTLIRKCTLLKRVPFHSEGIVNSINLFSC